MIGRCGLARTKVNRGRVAATRGERGGVKAQGAGAQDAEEKGGWGKGGKGAGAHGKAAARRWCWMGPSRVATPHP